MAYPRTTTRILATAATAIAVGTPALAADPEDGATEALRVAAPGSPAALALREDREAQAKRQRKLAAKRKERRQEGPFVPVVGSVDYGNAQNAFGASRSDHIHAGHDLFAPAGTPLVAVTDGVVVDVGSDGGQGNYVHLYDPEAGQTYIYMHLVAPAKHATGDKVKAGEQLGGVGCTGSCSGDHLHFEIREGKGMAGEARDPLPALEDWRTLKQPR